MVIFPVPPSASPHQDPEPGGQAGGESGGHHQLGEEGGPGPVHDQHGPAAGGPQGAQWAQEGDDEDGGQDEQAGPAGDHVAAVHQVLGEFEATQRHLPV